MQSGSGFIEEVECISGTGFAQFFGEFDALGLTTGKRGGRLPQLDVVQAYSFQQFQLLADGRYVFKEIICLLHIHIQYICDVFAFILDS